MTLSRRFVSIAILLWCSATAANPIQLSTSAVPLNPEDPEQTSIGAFQYMGGLALKSPSKMFGGFSGLAISRDGNTLTAVSDRGFWFVAKIYYDGQQRLANIAQGRLYPILNTLGQPVSGLDTDAEDLTRLSDGSWAVSFEHNHRIDRFSAPTPTAVAKRIAVPPELKNAPPNGGIEALTALPNGKLMAIAEQFESKEGHARGWLIDPVKGQWAPIRFLGKKGYHPVALATLPSGDVLVLERRFRGAGRLFWVCLSRIAAKAIAPGKLIAGKELAVIDSRLSSDNYEGLATRPDANGNDLVYLISDNNYASYQRNLLLQLKLRKASQ